MMILPSSSHRPWQGLEDSFRLKMDCFRGLLIYQRVTMVTLVNGLVEEKILTGNHGFYHDI